MKKLMRLTSLFLSIVMLVNMLNLQVFATEAGTEDTDNQYFVREEDKIYDETSEAAPARIVMELEGQREENVKHFLMSDHSVQAVVYAQPMHYLEDGEWEDIDNTLHYEGQTLDEAGGYVNAANDFEVRFAEKTGLEDFISIKQGEYELEWKYRNDVGLE